MDDSRKWFNAILNELRDDINFIHYQYEIIEEEHIVSMNDGRLESNGI